MITRRHPRSLQGPLALVAAFIVLAAGPAAATPAVSPDSTFMRLQTQPGVSVPPGVIRQMQQMAPEQVTVALRVCAGGVPHLHVEQLRGRDGQTRDAVLAAQALAEADAPGGSAARVLDYSIVLDETGKTGTLKTTLRRFGPAMPASPAEAGLLRTDDTRGQLFAAFPALALACPHTAAGTASDAAEVKAALSMVPPTGSAAALEFSDGELAVETFMQLTRQAAAQRAVDAVLDFRHYENGEPYRAQAHRWQFEHGSVTLFLELRGDAWRVGVAQHAMPPARPQPRDRRPLFARR